jgi:biotin-dependent carboxylase-like uncharacterized protein
MSAGLAVIAPGFGATIQDLGRTGYQAIGVPEGGALDPIMLRLANWLVGNEDGEGALEMRFGGPMLEVRGAPVRLAVAGDGAEIELLPPLEGRVPAYRSLTLTPGQSFRVVLAGGAPCYLAAEGGFAIPPVMGSLSTLPIGGIGGFQGRALAKGDLVPLRSSSQAGGGEMAMRPPKFPPLAAIRVILGPQADRFTEEALHSFLSEAFTISPFSDRMGLRLEGPRLAHSGGFDLISDGSPHGAVQVPGSGQPIVRLGIAARPAAIPRSPW